MKKVSNIESLLQIFNVRRECEGFEIAYSRYLGVGHWIYLFLKEENKQFLDIFSRRMNPRHMAERMVESIKDFVIIVATDMGGITIYEGANIK